MRPTLLIAEGDAGLRAVYQRFLSERGYDVQTASDGLDCLEKLRRVRPVVLVLDRELRWGGGDGVLAWLREEHAACKIPVVLTATVGSAPDVAADIRPPVVRFLFKPFALATLLASVRGVVAARGHEEPYQPNRVADRPDSSLG
jgi:DNA-binding response OmpR family regulator